MKYPTWITPILSGYLIGTGIGRLLASDTIVLPALFAIILGVIGTTLHFYHLYQAVNQTRRRDDTP